jgi:hypothetical protein
MLFLVLLAPLPLPAQRQVVSVPFRSVNSYMLVEVSIVEIAHQFMFSQSVSVMNLEDLSKRFQIHFDGLLGQDILNQFRSVRIDYKAHVIELER